uniref:Uncharacterized protein n=1 Tax=Mimiviridae sp. ChoanoV1 TaxID=2596887 RepID=A0A5B8IIC3_9VIRU|nr:hypothetical protein 3_41 [Mimiviridae sp. ChoanoV1]
MGKLLFDQYTYLHFSVGILFYFWGFDLITFLIIHIIFEYVENSVTGMKFINNNFKLWPGGKPKADSLLNIIGDNIGAIIGWVSAFYLDDLGNKMGWYEKHIN